MADIELTSTSTEGYATTNRIGDWELTIDATGEYVCSVGTDVDTY